MSDEFTDADEVAALRKRLKTVLTKIGNLDETNFDLPDASCPDPIQFGAYRQSLYDERDRLKMAIADAEGEWELESIADC